MKIDKIEAAITGTCTMIKELQVELEEANNKLKFFKMPYEYTNYELAIKQLNSITTDIEQINCLLVKNTRLLQSLCQDCASVTV